LLPTADSEKVNLAQTLKDGQQLRVPERKLDGTGARSQTKDDKGLVNINTADEKALDSLPGVGPAMAKRIIEYRETEGAFQSIEDIKKIKGIGETKFAKLKDKICI
jgi:competence protein ComEA